MICSFRGRSGSRDPRAGRPGRGFSLLELVVSIGLFGLFTLTISRLMMGGMQTFKRGEAMTTLRQDLRNALDLIATDLRQSSPNEVESPLLTGGKLRTLTLTFDRKVNGSASDHRITYRIDGVTNRLTREDLNLGSGQAQQLVAENVLVGARLGESASAELSQSYFVWTVNPLVSADSARMAASLEVRLTGVNQGQRLSLVTDVSPRGLSNNVGPVTVSEWPIVLPTDLRPPAPGALRPRILGGDALKGSGAGDRIETGWRGHRHD